MPPTRSNETPTQPPPDRPDSVPLNEQTGAGPSLPKTHDTSTPTPPLARVGRFEVLEEIGRGGMGCVLRARDLDLKRDLALKVLLAEHHGRPELERRFLEEAQVGGQLQHPGLVPVHEIGRFPDGRPFFAMKLIQGQTLDALLHARATPDEDRPRFLAVFEQVCQTLAYVHSKGVIHRDLKPSNIMVGAFGEVQVMDWGLTKRFQIAEVRLQISQAENASSSLLQSDFCNLKSSQTLPGTVIGTPAYMAPEQARGEIDRLDERADVFGLGAILCEILTGQPPFTELSQAKASDLTDARARIDGSGADGELIALAKACLATDRDQRPRDAGVLAARVTAYRTRVEERLRQAEIARAEAEVQTREERKRRRVVLALAASVVLSVAVVGAGLLWWQRDRDVRLTQTRAEVLPALSRAETWRQEARAIQGRSVAEAERAVGLLRQARTAVEQAESAVTTGLADDDLRRKVVEARTAADTEETAANERLALARQQVAFLTALEKARERRGRLVPGKSIKADLSTDCSRAFAAYGRDVTRGSPAEVVTWLRALPEDVREAALVALYHWWQYCSDPGLQRRLWILLEEVDEDPWRSRLRQAVRAKETRALLQLTHETKSRRLPAAGYELLAASLASRGCRSEAIELLRGARLRHPRDLWIPMQLATYLWQGHQTNVEQAVPASRGAWLGSWLALGTGAGGQEVALEEMVGCCRLAVALRPDGVTLGNLGAALEAQHKVEEAIAAYQQAIACDPHYATAHYNLGLALQSQNRVEEASAAFRQALACDPRDAEAHLKLGILLYSQDKVMEAIASYRQAIACQPKFAAAHNNLGNALRSQNKAEEAIAAYRQAIALEPRLAAAYCNLGTVLYSQNKVEEAITAYRQAIACDPKLANAHNNLGLALKAQSRMEEAIASFRQALAVEPRFAAAHYHLGTVLSAQHKVDEAIAAFRHAIVCDPKLAHAHGELGNALLGQNKVEEAIASFRQALACDPKLAMAHNNLGNAFRAQNKVEEAIASYRQAIECDPKLALAHDNLGKALAALHRGEEAIAAFRQATALDPRNADTHNNLGRALAGQNKMTEAIAAFRQAIVCNSKFALAHNNLGVALHAQDRLEEAIAAYRQAIVCDPKLGGAHTALGEALLRCGRFAQARESTLRALEFLPRADPRRRFAIQQLQQCDHFVRLDAKVSAILKGEAKPEHATEGLALAEVCRLKQHHATAVRFAVEAFAREPQRAADLRTALRYNAACDAALAGCRRGKDFPREAQGGAELRRQALTWLRADLGLLTQQVADGNPRDRADTAAMLRHWQRDPDLTGVRHSWSLLRLSTEERRAWQRLWADVGALLTHAGQE